MVKNTSINLSKLDNDSGGTTLVLIEMENHLQKG